MNGFLTAHQHTKGYSVPSMLKMLTLDVKSQERKNEKHVDEY
jgi:hypothetical protein